LLIFEIEEKRCFLVYKISEKDKKKFLKTDTFKIVESFILQCLINEGRNGYFDDRCPKCKQITLTKLRVVDTEGRPTGEKAIGCILCE
jgi:phage FluMu protein Com